MCSVYNMKMCLKINTEQFIALENFTCVGTTQSCRKGIQMKICVVVAASKTGSSSFQVTATSVLSDPTDELPPYTIQW